MPLPRDPLAYADVKAVLDSAIAAGGARFTPASHSPHTWLMRARMFRKLKRLEGDATYTSWDFAIEADSIRIFPLLAGTLTTLSGEPLSVGQPEVDADLDLEALRAELLRNK